MEAIFQGVESTGSLVMDMEGSVEQVIRPCLWLVRPAPPPVTLRAHCFAGIR
jgi:hypothetical protein